MSFRYILHNYYINTSPLFRTIGCFKGSNKPAIQLHLRSSQTGAGMPRVAELLRAMETLKLSVATVEQATGIEDFPKTSLPRSLQYNKCVKHGPPGQNICSSIKGLRVSLTTLLACTCLYYNPESPLKLSAPNILLPGKIMRLAGRLTSPPCSQRRMVAAGGRGGGTAVPWRCSDGGVLPEELVEIGVKAWVGLRIWMDMVKIIDGNILNIYIYLKIYICVCIYKTIYAYICIHNLPAERWDFSSTFVLGWESGA